MTITEFGLDVADGLGRTGQKALPAKYFYDELGSALFEAITLLPEYGLTRADERLLGRHAPEIARRLPLTRIVAELGSGSGRKTRPILEHLPGPILYHPIDVSGAALARCEQELSGVKGVTVAPVESTYLDGLKLACSRRSPRDRMLVLFLGSTIGNFEREEAAGFLTQVRARLEPGDALLLGADLVKAPEMLIDAYDDPVGVTAAFNRNLLARMNRELDAQFDPRQFAHEARWNAEAERIEMHLCSLTRQEVAIPGAGITIRFESGETIRTESSHKFRAGNLPLLAVRCGFVPSAQWVDAQWPFSENLWMVE